MSELRPQNYKDPRAPERFTRYHEFARSHDAGPTYDVVRMIATPISLLLYRARAIEAANVPPSGPLILAANHFSNMDHFLIGTQLRRKLRFMAKSQLFGNPLGDYIFTRGGVFPVRRGYGDEEAFRTMGAIFERGGMVMIYIEGGRSRSGRIGGPGDAKPGVGRAALQWGVPVVPVAVHGSQGIRRWKRLSFPKVTVRFGQPLRFEPEPDAGRERHLEVSEQVFAAVRAMYHELEEEGRASVMRRRRSAGSPGGPSYS